jgi:hypothetical protein
MIVMSICAVLCGCDDWVDVADWCEEEADWLKTFLVLAKGTPSHDTFGEVFRVLDAKVFESCFRQWIASVVGVVEGVVAFDGGRYADRRTGRTRRCTWSARIRRNWAYRWDRKVRRARQ